MRAANGGGTCLAKPEVLDLSLRDQVLHGAGDVLDRNGGVDPVLVEESDRVDPEPLQRVLGDLTDVLGATVGFAGPAGAEVKAELGGDDDVLREGGQRLTDQFLVGERSVD